MFNFFSKTNPGIENYFFYAGFLSLICLAWTYWPSNKKGFDEAAKMHVLDEEDRPWR